MNIVLVIWENLSICAQPTVAIANVSVSCFFGFWVTTNLDTDLRNVFAHRSKMGHHHGPIGGDKNVC